MTEEISRQLQNVKQTIQNLNIRSHSPPEELTKNYGFMKFDAEKLDATTRLSHYIRLSHDTSAEAVVQFMRQGWGLPDPNLIISITGGAKHCNMSARLRKVFQSGLVSAAINTNAWVITAGTNAGVVKEVGDAFNNYRYKTEKQGVNVPCIGIGSWGYTDGNEQLSDAPISIPLMVGSKRGHSIIGLHHTETPRSVVMNLDDQHGIRNYVVPKKQKKRCDLEPNHSHFLLFDDGDTNADNILQLRAEIETLSREIRSEDVSETRKDSLIPIVMILLEGGPSSMRTICRALKANTPVVVVKESGRAADIVADLYAIYSGGDSNNQSGHSARPQTSHAKGGLKESDIQRMFAEARKDMTSLDDEIQKELCDTVKAQKHLITIFKFDSKRYRGNLEDAILESLFSAAKRSDSSNDSNNHVAELKLAIAWHKIDYARKQLLNDATIAKWDKDDLRRGLIDTLQRGHVDFLELFLEFGTPLESLTNGDLQKLYSASSPGVRLPLKHRGRHVPSTKEDFYADYLHMEEDETITRSNHSDEFKNQTLGADAPQALFLWAVFLDRHELATYLCSKTWNSSMAALLGAHIYRRATRLAIDLEIIAQYEKHAAQFDNHAMVIIDRCFDVDEHFAVGIIKRPAIAFHNFNPLITAQKADCKSFLASKTVQKHLDNEWFGHINYKRQLIEFRIFLCTLFLPLLPIFCYSLPYVRKHQNIVRAMYDQSKLSQSPAAEDPTKSKRRKGKNAVGCLDKIIYFYQAPIVRFYYYTIFFVIFLLLFSFVLLVDYFPLNNYGERRSGYANLKIPITEIILHICIWSLIVEEIRQFLSLRAKRHYIAEVWNVIDVISIVFYLVAFISRFFVVEQAYIVSKIFMCLDFICWAVRTLHIFSAFEKLGPKLIMILNTMKDLLFFVCFIVIFLLAYSISSWSLLSTDNQVTWYYDGSGTLTNATVAGSGSGLWTWQTIRDVVNFGVWKIFGQVDPIPGTDGYSVVTFILTIVFVTIANVLLLNLLIALFNVTIQAIEKESYKIWRFQRFRLVNEYSNKPPLPPPFSVFFNAYSAICFMKENIQDCRQKSLNAVVASSIMDSVIGSEMRDRKELQINDAMRRENAIAEDYWSHVLKQGKDHIEVSLQNIERKLQNLQERIYSDKSLDEE